MKEDNNNWGITSVQIGDKIYGIKGVVINEFGRYDLDELKDIEKEAVANENYEKAARIRDEIRKREY